MTARSEDVCHGGVPTPTPPCVRKTVEPDGGLSEFSPTPPPRRSGAQACRENIPLPLLFSIPGNKSHRGSTKRARKARCIPCAWIYGATCTLPSSNNTDAPQATGVHGECVPPEQRAACRGGACTQPWSARLPARVAVWGPPAFLVSVTAAVRRYFFPLRHCRAAIPLLPPSELPSCLQTPHVPFPPHRPPHPPSPSRLPFPSLCPASLPPTSKTMTSVYGASSGKRARTETYAAPASDDDQPALPSHATLDALHLRLMELSREQLTDL